MEESGSKRRGYICTRIYLKMDLIWHIAEIAFLNYLKELKNVEVLQEKKVLHIKIILEYYQKIIRNLSKIKKISSSTLNKTILIKRRYFRFE